LLLCFVFPIICHPPLSTLFPYTTLFRSAFCALQRTGVDRPRAAQMLRDEHACGFVARDDARRDLERGGLGGDPRFVDEIERARADRKSTRLNSSHVKISYAVFCLKKKKK